ncbi:MAG: YadA-like family protein [Pseudomonas sp.]|uniref:YadA-like family protein n=1 Tax=Pseudomonas sp. TaxID=306 RepID=UPI00299DBAA2|nr:YadA-like family protein [Pseudomonas sp.]MDX1725770.1 YadA-like family protein [Pseudomonas sp.]
MQMSAGTSKLECTQHAVPGRKSLLACALLAILAGNQAMAQTLTDIGGTPIDQLDVTGIFIDDSVGGVPGNGNEISLDAAQGTIDIVDGSGSTTSLGGVQSSFGGNVEVLNGGSLSVEGNTSVTTLSATDVTADSVTAATVNGATVNSATIVNTGSITSDTISATDVTANTVTAATVNGATVNSTTIANTGSITSGTINATAITGGTITGSLDAAGNKITNVAAGTVGTDAVNYDQLSAVQSGYNSRYDELSSQTNARFNYMDGRIDKVEEVANAGIASVAALAAIPSPAHGKRFSVGAGLGNYSSESAVAVGFRAAITESTSVTAGVSRNTASKTAANLGVGYSW